ncbi:hypothetical protein ES708_33416 [subsurface metagenome]
MTPENNYFRLNGIKSFCSGSQDSDILPISATNQETGELSILAIPTQRQGVTVHHDWNNIGQRQTDSGSVTFEDVLVYNIFFMYFAFCLTRNQIFFDVALRTYIFSKINLIYSCFFSENMQYYPYS